MQTTYIFCKSENGLARQAQAILNIVEAKSPITKSDLLDQIELDVKSKQKAQRLLSYYKGQLVTKGLIEERKHG
jgi:hypothetical protein